MIHWKRIVILMLSNICLVTFSYFVSKDIQVIFSKPLNNQDLKEALYENIKLHNEKFSITFRGNTEQIEQQLEQMMHDLQYEDPYSYENIMQWNANFTYTSEQATVNFFITYLITLEQEHFVEQEVNRLAQELTHDKMSDLEKARVIHDYVVRQAEYSSETSTSQYSPYTILIERKGVCQAYAFLIYRLLQEVNIEVLYVKGQAGGSLHSWNLVKLGNEWYHLDATWNDSIVDGGRDIEHPYFLVTDQQMNLTHSWKQSAYPSTVVASKKYNAKHRLGEQQHVAISLGPNE